MRHERNRPCPCGSGTKFKRCCGRSRETHGRLDARLDATECVVALATLTPCLRPASGSFDAWAAHVDGEPERAVVAAGIEAMGAAERDRIVADCEALCGEAWRSARDDLGDADEAETLLLVGAVVAGLEEQRRLPGPAVFEEIERHLADCANPVCAVATALDPTDVWGLTDAAEAHAGALTPAEFARSRWTDGHERRLGRVLAHLEASVDAAPPAARAAIRDGTRVVSDDAEARDVLVASLLLHSIELFDAIAAAA